MSFLKPIKQKIKEGSKKLVKEIERLKIYCNGGYKKIQPRMFGKGVLSMVHPSIIESEEDNCKEQFIPCLGSMKRRVNIPNSYTTNMRSKSNRVELPEKDILTCQIVPNERKHTDHAYNVCFQRITPHQKLGLLRRQSTAPEFI